MNVCPDQRNGVASMSPSLLEDYAHYRRGEAAAVSPVIAQITGTAPRSIDQLARDNAAAFAGESFG
jgi:hypothetical protein